MATGKYIQFVQPLIDSANKHFLRNHHVTYFVFTDQEFDPDEHTVVAFQARLGWPYDTMMRYHTYYKYRDLFADQDYLFALDADMLFVNTVGDEVLGERVATQHPGFVGRRGTYETCAYSNAFVSEVEGDIYFAGGFYGASTEEFLQILQTNIEMIDDDLNRGYIAVWHDESHWNRYCIDHPPTVILSPSYCYPESWKLNFPKKLLALDKNHHEIRQ
jgi:histo-blood group ABO system transferase